MAARQTFKGLVLYSKIIDFDNLMTAYHAARRGKRYRPEVARFTARLEENLINLHNHLVWQTWAPSPPREFTIMEPKMRHIQAPPFPDRIVHHALVSQVEPLFEKRFIKRSYACRAGKGTHAAVHDLQQMLRKARRRWRSVYVVQADVRKFFASIDHAVALEHVATVVKCKDTLNLWSTVLGGYGHECGLGLPVGSLTSQLTANIVLDGADHEMTDLHGVGRYLRYMDDIIMLFPGKAEAWRGLDLLQDALARRKLHLNPKTQIRPASSGVDWCGYRTWTTHVLPRKRTIKRARSRLRKAQFKYDKDRSALDEYRQQVCCLLAYTKHCHAHQTVEAILSETAPGRQKCK